MQAAIGYKGGFNIEIHKFPDLRHHGLGSTGCLQAAVASGINLLFDFPLLPPTLIRYLAQNHGEEIAGNSEFLNPVQCIGGSAASGLIAGGVIVLAGESAVIGSAEIPEEHSIVIGIPEDCVPLDSLAQFEAEKRRLHRFLRTSERYREEIAYQVLHQFLPAMVNQDLKTMGDVIFDYRFRKGSIRNCAYTHPRLLSITRNLSSLKLKDRVDILSISSVGPAVFGIARDTQECEAAFRRNRLRVVKTKACNGRFQVLEVK